MGVYIYNYIYYMYISDICSSFVSVFIFLQQFAIASNGKNLLNILKLIAFTDMLDVKPQPLTASTGLPLWFSAALRWTSKLIADHTHISLATNWRISLVLTSPYDRQFHILCICIICIYILFNPTARGWWSKLRHIISCDGFTTNQWFIVFVRSPSS